MKLEQYIALHLALIVCLSSFMLGTGQGDFVLPTITLVAAAISLWAVDFKKLFYIGPVLSNTLILLILLFSVGYLMQAFDASFGGSLFAIAILRVLVFFQLVLLFRKKENRTCWNIIMVSFVEVIVASVFQQTVLFGLLMVLYLFAALTVVALMHLNRDRNYFVEHVFLRSLFRVSWKDVFSKQGFSQLLKYAFSNMFSGPLAVIAWFRGKYKAPESVSGATPESSGVWEVSEPLLQMTKNGRRRSSSVSPGRWPLALEKATFSSSAANRGGLIGVGREFYYRLIVATIVSLVVGGGIFFLTPRQSFRIAKLEIQKEDWQRSNSQPLSGVLNTVGFNEEIRLGSLGTVLDNPEEVMYVAFAQPNQAETSQAPPYTSIYNQSVYFRGVVLQDYARGRWSGGERNKQQIYRSDRLGTSESPGRPREWENLPQPDSNDWHASLSHMWENQRPLANMFQDRVPFPINSVVDLEKQPSAVIDWPKREQCRFQPGTQLVEVRCEYVRPAQGIVFSVWPYFLAQPKNTHNFVFFQDRIIARRNFDNQERRKKLLAFQFLTHTFQNGRQLDLIPCQEPLDVQAMLAFDETELSTVGSVATQWDASHQGRSSIERAQNLERHFLTDERYYYALGGVMRNSTLDPLEDFVKNHPGGHCEYFAGALAIMLRKIGIPSRVVVGYRLDTGIGLQGNDRYVVRQSDAHSWVEAYIAPEEIPESLRNGPYADWWSRGGWLRLDPTASLRETMAQNGFWANLKYRTASFWNDYIVNFDANRQEAAIFSPVTDFFSSMQGRFFDAEYWQTIGKAVLEKYTTIFKEIRRGNWHGSDLLLLGVPLLIVLAICYLVYRLARLFARELRRLKLSRAKQHRLVTVDFYRRFEKILQRLRLSRVATETQREFAARVSADLAAAALTCPVEQANDTQAASKLPELVTAPTAEQVQIDQLPQKIVEAYYRVRYGDTKLTQVEASEINTILQHFENAVMQCKQGNGRRMIIGLGTRKASSKSRK